MLMKAENPLDGKTYFFVDKCVPFGSSISCKLFQSFSDGLAHIQRVKSGKKPVNYLDDFLFAAYLKSLCNYQLETFINICKRIKFPVSMEKTVYATTMILFLGLLIDGKHYYVAIPLEKLQKALSLISDVLKAKKMKVHQMQKDMWIFELSGKKHSSRENIHL